MNHPTNLETMANEKIDGIRTEGLSNQALQRAGAFGNGDPNLFKQFSHRLLKIRIGKFFRQESTPIDVEFQRELPRA